ncbi:PP2C family protein-serine/threonine phosphatase [Teredinibacter purpureus]|uniref:PP2C family protein-serine/threonine phosphatase n=1 Tax=Teredinibacter purpureus TaxID=2731756 RepID=UPI0005F84080|nr:SpoIIE family protein phosphatase [Teredinibacter purpureus]
MAESNRQLLVIDDDTIVRKSIVAYLTNAGFNVYEVSDPASGMAWLQFNVPDLIITDLCKPEKDRDSLATLKDVHQNFPNIPVIVMSGMGVVRDVVEALRHGAADYLIKPLVDIEILVHSINRALERSLLLAENRLYRDELEQLNGELAENVRLLEHDQKAGRSVQSKLMPKTPKQYGPLNVSYKIIPSLYLSGDFIDYSLRGGRYLAFYLTDVSGHGAAPAFVTVWLKQLVSRVFREHHIFESEESFQRDASGLMKLINKEILNSRVGCHLTCFVGIIDTQTHEMRYVVAGHLPLPVLLAGSRAEYVNGKGKPLGMFEDGEWDVSVLQLPEDFSLVIFSDGVLEVLPPPQLIEKESYLLQQLADSQLELSAAPAKGEGVEKLCQVLNLNNLETVPDDIAILKIRGSLTSSAREV